MGAESAPPASEPTIADLLNSPTGGDSHEAASEPGECAACGDRWTDRLAGCLKGKTGAGEGGHSPWIIALVIVIILVIAYFAYARYKKKQTIKQAAQSALNTVESTLHIS